MENPVEDWRKVPCVIGGYRRSRRIWTKLNGDPGDLFVLHRCNQVKCWEPRHFYLGTRSDNLRDAYDDGVLKRFRPHCAACGKVIKTGIIVVTVEDKPYHRRCTNPPTPAPPKNFTPEVRARISAGVKAAKVRRFHK